MQRVLEKLGVDDEAGLIGFGQSNRQPRGDRDTEGYVAAPHLQLRAAGLDVTIQQIVGVEGAAHGGVGTSSLVTVAEELLLDDWVGGELRLVHHEYGDAIASSLRVGHAAVTACVPSASSAVAINVDTNLVTWESHGRVNGSQVVFGSFGTLPGLVAGRVYYVKQATAHTFQVSADPFGATVDLVGGTGVHVATAQPYLVVTWISTALAASACTFALGLPGIVTQAGHGLTHGSQVSFAAGLPVDLVEGQAYYVTVIDADTYSVSEQQGGALLEFTGTGSATGTPVTLANVTGYVHLHDKWTSYDNVLVVTPYQPIEPGDYPAGVPVVPGVALAADVQSYADAALVLPYTWNEGVDGYGHDGTATVVGTVVTLSGGQTIEAGLFAGGFVRVGNAKGRVASNTATTITVESWTPSTGPGAGALPCVVHLPHWRNNPHHFSAGEGFLYPSGEMQPGGQLATSTGLTYSRPRGRLAGSYVDRTLAPVPASAAINVSQLAELRTTTGAQLSVQQVSVTLVVTRLDAANDPAAGLPQFERWLRAGYIVELIGFGTTPSSDGVWRVASVTASTASAGASIVLVRLMPDLEGLPPIGVNANAPAGAVVRRMFYRPVYKFGALIETAWRMANAIGKRLVVAHLGVGGSSQVYAQVNNRTGFQGRLGWYDDDLAYDWTPARANGLAARLRRIVEWIAPRAVAASLGAAKRWKVLAADGWQGESDSTLAAGRALAPRSIPTFVDWLRSVVVGAQLSPYPADAKLPVHWARITTFPFSILDTLGEINAAIARMQAFDGFVASWNPDGQPKLLDAVHFTGVGEANNGKAVADLLLPLIDYALQFGLGTGAVDVANSALSLIGDAPNVTALEPPNGTTQAKLCAQMLPDVRREILQSHPWTWATRRVALQTVAAPVSSWAYAYALPPDLLHPTAVLDPDAPDDLQVRAAKVYDARYPARSTVREPASQPFKIETDQEGNRILRTDQPNAVLIYVARNVDFGLWDPLVRQACAYRLAHKLAGGTIKGRTGAALSRDLLQTSLALQAQAGAMNAEWQQDVRPQVDCDWLP